jgi:hypothetical protein
MQPIANSFWNETLNDDLYNSTIQINTHITHLNNSLKNACYKQLVFTGMLADDIKRMYGHVMDGANPITISGENAEADALELTYDFKAFFETLHSIAAHVMDQHGVEFDSQTASAQKSSGVAMVIKKEAFAKSKSRYLDQPRKR